MNRRYSLLLTCEHAGNQLPGRYRHLFNGNEEILQTHQGWDPGAWTVAQHLASALNVPVFSCHVSRLLIEVNRSLDHPQLFSAFTHLLNDHEKKILIDSIYQAYRLPVENAIDAAKNSVAHFSIHSFTPVFDGQVREMDIGILFDPGRSGEAVLSHHLKDNLMTALPGFNVVFNQPYRGTDDGFTTYLRKSFSEEEYAGIEIEINQRLFDIKDWRSLCQGLVNVLSTL
jgi:predicted N-formylglutamate amidohydrolase